MLLISLKEIWARERLRRFYVNARVNFSIKYYKRLRNLEYDKKVKELAKIRDEEGYMAESKREPKKRKTCSRRIQLSNYTHSRKPLGSMSPETELFEKLLGADIQTTHRVEKGDLVCKFVIKERKEGHL